MNPADHYSDPLYRARQQHAYRQQRKAAAAARGSVPVPPAISGKGARRNEEKIRLAEEKILAISDKAQHAIRRYEEGLRLAEEKIMDAVPDTTALFPATGVPDSYRQWTEARARFVRSGNDEHKKIMLSHVDLTSHQLVTPQQRRPRVQLSLREKFLFTLGLLTALGLCLVVLIIAGIVVLS